MAEIDINCIEDDFKYLRLLGCILAMLYTFLGCAILTEKFFVPILETIRHQFRIPQDIAGATLMALGSSAPEICVSVIDTVFGEEDLGLQSVLGSAIFNVCVIVASCAFVMPVNLALTRNILIRDTVCFIISVGYLAFILRDGVVKSYEAVGFLVIYIFYIAYLMLSSHFTKRSISHGSNLSISGTILSQTFMSSYVSRDILSEKHVRARTLLDTYGTGNSIDHGLRFSSQAEPRAFSEGDPDWNRRSLNVEDPFRLGEHRLTGGVFWYEVPVLEAREDADITIKEESICEKIFYILEFPLNFLFYFTIPTSYVFLSFFMCCAWIIVFSYFLIQFTKLIGCLLQVRLAFMGFVLMASGTSIPDMFCSMGAAKRKKGDMAMANVSGSNISNVLIGLGLPWTIKTIFISRHEPNTENLTVPLIFLIFVLIFTIASFAYNNFMLTSCFGYQLVFIYLTYVVVEGLNIYIFQWNI